MEFGFNTLSCVVLQIIAVVSLMIQSYIVTEEDSKRLNADREVFQWLLTVLDCAICGKPWSGYGFGVSEVIKVRGFVS